MTIHKLSTYDLHATGDRCSELQQHLRVSQDLSAAFGNVPKAVESVLLFMKESGLAPSLLLLSLVLLLLAFFPF